MRDATLFANVFQALLAALFAIIGLVCFNLTVRSSRQGSFSIDKSAVTLAGGSRLEFSKPMVFAVGTVLCFALAAALMLYRQPSTPANDGLNKQEKQEKQEKK